MRELIYLGIDLLSGVIGSLPILLILYALWGTEKSRKKTGWGILFILYISLMCLVVGIPSFRYIRWSPNGSLIPFRDHYISSYLYQTGMNIIMFLPFGFLLPIIWKQYRSVWRTTLAGALTSLGIELMQMFCIRATDIDDFIMNTVGTLLGCLLVRFLFGSTWWKETQGSDDVRRKERMELITILVVCLLANILIRNEARVWIYRIIQLIR